MKALSLMQWVASCGHSLIFHTSLWRTFVEGPGVGEKGFESSVSQVRQSLQTFTDSGGDFHNAPRVIAPLTDDEI